LQNSDYRAAAQRFKEVQQKYPNTRYMASAMYYQAFSLYRNGTDAELREALSVLDARAQKFPNARMEDPGFPNRIRGALAARGDAAAKRALSESAGSSQSCDREEQSVQASALSALAQADPQAATPSLEKILAKRDECSLELRRTALRIYTRRGDEKAVATLLSTAKSEQNDGVRRTAARNLVGYPSPKARESVRRLIENDTIPEGIRTDMLG